MKILLFVILLQIILQCYAQEIVFSCTTPGDQSGICIPLRECGYLYELVQRTTLKASDRSFLQKSHCGNRDGQVHICCANNHRVNKSQPPSTQPKPKAQPQLTFATNRSSLLPQAPYCGDSFSDRVVGGSNTGKKEFPWLVLIEYTKSDNTKSHRCGGSLINDQYVLTAAHCVIGIPKTFQLTGVRLGDWDTSTNPDCTTERNGKIDCNDPYVDVAVSEVIPHPQYPGLANNQLHDIALLRLATQVSFTDSISPVCLPLWPDQQNNTFLGRKMIVSGWGRTLTNSTANIKQKAELDPVPTANCNNRFTTQHRTITSTQICAGGVNGIDSCRGDSGGPLVMLDMHDGNSNYYLTGVVSYGPTPCGLAGWPGVYTLVSAYIDWIEATIGA